MNVKDEVEVISVNAKDKELGIEIGRLGTIERIKGGLVWVKFYDSAIYNRVDLIRAAIKGIVDVDYAIPEEIYRDDIKAFCMGVSQIKVTKPTVSIGDIVKVCDVTPVQRRELGIKEGDVGIICEDAGSQIKVKMRGNLLLDAKPYIVPLNKTDVKFVGMNVSDL